MAYESTKEQGATAQVSIRVEVYNRLMDYTRDHFLPQWIVPTWVLEQYCNWARDNIPEYNRLGDTKRLRNREGVVEKRIYVRASTIEGLRPLAAACEMPLSAFIEEALNWFFDAQQRQPRWSRERMAPGIGVQFQALQTRRKA